MLVVLPAANATAGVPYLRARLPEDDGAWFVHQGALIAGHVVLVLLVVGWARTRGFDLGLRERRAVGVGAIAACVAVAAIVAAQQQLEPLVDAQDVGAFSRWAQAVSITSILWAGVGQELLFRAFALPLVADAIRSPGLAVLLTSSAFALYHGGFAFGIGNLAANFAGGVALGVVFLRTRNLWAAAVPHAALITVLLVAS